MKITINKQELEFNYNYSQIKQLCNAKGKRLDELKDIAEDFGNADLILSIGSNLPLEDATKLLDEDGSFEAVRLIIESFSNEVVRYMNPNSPSQTA
jgi:hypothetical protein